MAQDDPLVVVSRLRKLCAAKDAQIEGLTSRVEVLTDDLHALPPDSLAFAARRFFILIRAKHRTSRTRANWEERQAESSLRSAWRPVLRGRR